MCITSMTLACPDTQSCDAVLVSCRWFGYATDFMADVPQAAEPATPATDTSSADDPVDGSHEDAGAAADSPDAVDNAALPVDGRKFPPGLLSEDHSVPRTKWPADQELVCCSTWSSDNKLKLGEKEYEATANKAEAIWLWAEARHPRDNLTGVEAMRRYDKMVQEANRLHLRLGCRGKPVFAKLSYHRCVSTTANCALRTWPFHCHSLRAHAA